MWHVAAHEIGHAIYGLDGVKDVIKTSTKTLLEEPRAELTALHTMTLLEPAGLLSKVCCQPTVLPRLFCRGLTPLPCLFVADSEALLSQSQLHGLGLLQEPTGAYKATGWMRLWRKAHEGIRSHDV